MKCLIYFGMSSMKEGTSAQLSGRGELHGGARVTTLVTLRKCTLGNKREIKTLKFVLASTKGFKGGLAWIKPSKKDMAVTFSYSCEIPCPAVPMSMPQPLCECNVNIIQSMLILSGSAPRYPTLQGTLRYSGSKSEQATVQFVQCLPHPAFQGQRVVFHVL